MAENETLSLVLRFNHQPPPRTTLGREMTRSLQCMAPFGDRLIEAVTGRALPCDRGGVADYLTLRGPEGALWARVVTNSEQEMNPDSRVLLSAARDGFGMRRAALDWRLTEMDYRTMQRSTLALARYVAEAKLGRMRVYDWLLAEDPVAPRPSDGNGHGGSWHHMGATRMADDPRRGVVDRNCRVHGIRNLYIGGSSVFASVGYVNPTYTITQLALRLGDHLGRELHS
jgi:choline dehydrogenase-like flavoprotein